MTMKKLLFTLMLLIAASVAVSGQDLPRSLADPVITVEVLDESVVINVTGEGTLLLYVDDRRVNIPYTIPRTDVDQTVELTAIARNTIDRDRTVTEVYVVPRLVYTEAPVINALVQGDVVIFTATGEGEVRLYADGVEVANPYTVARTDVDQTVELIATAHVDTQIDGTATLVYDIPKMEQTEAPVITAVEEGEVVIITATGEGEVRLYADGVEVANPYTVARTDVDQTIEFNAIAHVDGQFDGTTTWVCVIPKMEQTDAPVITAEEQSDGVTFTATGEGEIHLYADGVEVSNPYTVARTDVDQVVELTATAHVDGQFDGIATMVYVVPPMVQTDPPIIVCEVDEHYGFATIFAYSEIESEVHLYIYGEEVENPITMCNTGCDGMTIDIFAIAHVDGQIDGYASAVCTIPDAPLLTGDIVISDPDENGIVTVCYVGGDADLMEIYVTGQDPVFVNLPNSVNITVDEGETEITVWVKGGRTCQMECESKTVTYTAAPTELSDIPNFQIHINEYELFRFDVTIECTVPEAVLYYRYAVDAWAPDIESAEWNCAEGGYCQLTFDWQTQGCQFIFQAYAVEPGKLPSPMLEIPFTNFYDHYRRYRQNYDFMVDGIYYMILSDSTLAVSSETIERTYGIDLLFPDQYNGSPITFYYGDVIVPPTVEYNGTTYTVTSVNPFAFVESELSSVVLPNTITEICSGAFYGTTITSLVLPEALTECGVGAFAETKGLSEVVLPDAFTSIPGSMFLGSEDLTSVTIGSAVTIVNEGAFLGCPLLAKVICHATTPPTLDLVANEFENYNSATLFVPAESLEAYQAHEQWGQFYRIVPFLGAGPGDVNGDGKLSISDVTGIINELLSGDELPAYCDVNGDGMVNITDVTALINMLLSSN